MQYYQSGGGLTGYIVHHLTHNAIQLGGDKFHLDSWAIALALGLLACFLLWTQARKATSGVPSKPQAFVELVVEFVDSQVKDTFHGDRRFIAPLALTIFVWVVFMNTMDLLPLDLPSAVITATAGQEAAHHTFLRMVPTADVNTTFALALAVWFLMIFYSVKVKGLGGWIHELFCSPFGSNPLLWPANFLLNIIEYVSKPLSHSLRLYGNMYAGEIIFLLLGLWAATGLAGTVFGAILGAGWAIFHILIVVLQAFIFMMLTVVYLAMAHESH